MLTAATKRWLSLKEAAEYSNIGRHRLVEMAREGKIKGFQDLESGRKELSTLSTQFTLP